LALLINLVLLAPAGFAQEDEEPPTAEPAAAPASPDTLLPRISAALQGVTTRDVAALARALHAGNGLEGASPGRPDNSLAPLGDMDGDGVPEVLLKWAISEPGAGEGTVTAPDLGSLWSVYLLSWDGAHWKASRLLAAAEDFTYLVVSLGPPVGRGLALVLQVGDSQAAYPAIFQLKDHVATLLWDAQADDSRYDPLLQSRVSFQERAGAPAEMIETGRADPGLLRLSPKGRRGFQARIVYRWDGKAFVPAKTDYVPDPDYTLYRFISALHLHDYRSAYALVVPAEFLNAGSPTLDAFRTFIQNHWPEFLQDAVFEAPEPAAGSPDQHLFIWAKPDARYVYHPVFSSDGKYLLTGLTRSQEASEP
jgi:hypothetical protein